MTTPTEDQAPAGETPLAPDWWRKAREEWRLSKSNLICRLHHCNCPGDENGAFPETAICFAAERLIEEMSAKYDAEAEAEKAQEAKP